MNFHVLLCVFLGTMLAAADDDANEPKGIDAYAVGEGSGDDLLEDEGNKDRILSFILQLFSLIFLFFVEARLLLTIPRTHVSCYMQYVYTY